MAAHLSLWLNLPHLVQAIAALSLAGFVPGALLVAVLLPATAAGPDWWERALYSVAAALAVMVVGMLLVSYLPGAVTATQILVAFDAMAVTLAVWLVWRQADEPGAASANSLQPMLNRWVLIGALVLAAVGVLFRFTNLGYADFQGDEARAALRAAAVIQGYEDVLLLHKKGPTEILLPTLVYALTGHLNELTARLLFAIANFVALFAVWLLGWRLFNPLTGWIAAMLLALDGYFIGFAHIVQYQSVVFLMSIVGVLIVHRLVIEPRRVTAYLTLAAIFLATGLLSHYEGVLAALPMTYLLGVLVWRNRSDWRALLGATLIAGLVGGAVLALFYGPYVLNPRFAATYQYLTDRRIGGSPPYNNLVDVFMRTTLYSTTYYVLLVIAAMLVGMVRVYRRGCHWLLAGAASLLLVAVIALSFLRPAWLQLGERDWAVIPFALLIALVIVSPRQRIEERMLWLWFGAVMLLAIFLTEKPRTHVYTFFMPWLLLAGMVLSDGWFALRGRIGARFATAIGVVAAALCTLVFTNYAYWFFVSQSEVMLNYDTQRPSGYAVLYDEPDNKARFGFPLNNGWKTIGELYRQGVLSGYFASNEKEAWVPAWYSRGVERCEREAQWFFEIRNLEPFSNEDFLKMEHYLRDGFVKWGRVQVNGLDKLTIYKRTGEKRETPTKDPVDGLPIYRFEEDASAFDENALADLPLTYPSVDPAIANPLHVNFGNLIWLEGYVISHPQPLRQGDLIRLTLYWRAQTPIAANYKVFNQVYANDGPMIAQRDGYPVCDSRETWRWDPGELITDFYDLPVKPDAPDGLYPLYTGFYDEATGDRLSLLDDAGAEIGTQMHVTDIRIGVE